MDPQMVEFLRNRYPSLAKGVTRQQHDEITAMETRVELRIAEAATEMPECLLVGFWLGPLVEAPVDKAQQVEDALYAVGREAFHAL